MKPETPQADYDELRRLVIEELGSVREPMLTLLHRLRPRGVKLTVNAMVKLHDHITHKDYFLCCTRKADASLPFKDRRLCLPGGHVDPEDFRAQGALNDTINHAALRELEEETGLKGTDSQIIYRDLDECNTLCYMVKVAYENPANANKPEPGTSIQWLELNELLERAAFPEYYRRAAEKGVFAL